MRYGVIWHPASTNLGDDMQTLAASRLLPRVDRTLDGERLDEPPKVSLDFKIFPSNFSKEKR